MKGTATAPLVAALTATTTAIEIKRFVNMNSLPG
jgi:hypothetical protein